MAYTVSQLKEDLEGMIHGASVDKVQNLNALIYRAARKVLTDCDPYETKRVQQVTNAVYDKIYNYSVPDDLKGKKIIDIRPQVNRVVGDNFSQLHSREFDQYKNQYDNVFVVDSNSGVKFVRIDKSTTPGIVINQNDGVTTNGTWSVGGDATNITTDRLNYVSGSGSLNFDVTGSGTTAYIENPTMQPIDLTNNEDIAPNFIWFYIPSGATVTDMTLRWGSSSVNYWEKTVTEPQFGSLVTGWNLIRFDWDTATETGTPVVSGTDYLRFGFTYDGDAHTDFRVDNVISTRGNIWEIMYYSKYLFRTDAGVWQESVTDDSNIINLDTDSYNLLLFKSAQYVAQQMQGEDSTFDSKEFKSEYKEALTNYQTPNKSERIKPQSTYYRK